MFKIRFFLLLLFLSICGNVNAQGDKGYKLIDKEIKLLEEEMNWAVFLYDAKQYSRAGKQAENAIIKANRISKNINSTMDSLGMAPIDLRLKLFRVLDINEKCNAILAKIELINGYLDNAMERLRKVIGEYEGGGGVLAHEGATDEINFLYALCCFYKKEYEDVKWALKSVYSQQNPDYKNSDYEYPLLACLLIYNAYVRQGNIEEANKYLEIAIERYSYDWTRHIVDFYTDNLSVNELWKIINNAEQRAIIHYFIGLRFQIEKDDPAWAKFEFENAYRGDEGNFGSIFAKYELDLLEKEKK